MVYRGKPSAGCENCRKAKKRCTLEQPACSRCVKLRKPCTGYRDTNSLQIQDESEAVRLKANRQARRTAQAIVADENAFAPSVTRRESMQTLVGLPTPGSSSTESSSGNDGMLSSPAVDRSRNEFRYKDLVRDFSKVEAEQDLGSYTSLTPLHSAANPVTYTFAPAPDDMATCHFFNQFTSFQHWYFLRDFVKKPRLDPCLDLAIKACGMAALDNVENICGSLGRVYARGMYADALGLLNATLRDAKRCKTDEALIAVILLGYFENLTCDSRESIQSWKAHIAGATQLLKIRGKAQFKSRIGRLLFRELRVQILIHCIWDDLDPPAFLDEWEEDLQAASVEFQHISRPVDDLAKISFDFAKVRAAIEKDTVSDVEAANICARLDARLIKWGLENSQRSQFWRYHEVEVADSPHIWNGVVHAYGGSPSASVWNTLRSVRILVSRSQEFLAGRFHYTAEEREEQFRYFRRVRRQMTDEICAGTPACLGHAPNGAYNSKTIILSAYSCIWPLFFAGTCALERISPEDLDKEPAQTPPSQPTTSPPNLPQVSAAQAQASWIWGRLDYISNVVGLKWASGIAGVLKGDFRRHEDLLRNDNSKPLHPSKAMHTTSWVKQLREAQKAREQGSHKPFKCLIGYPDDMDGENQDYMARSDWRTSRHERKAHQQPFQTTATMSSLARSTSRATTALTRTYRASRQTPQILRRYLTTPTEQPRLRLGSTAPNFRALTTHGEIDFHTWLSDSWAILFSHPADFTPVCTTELGAFARLAHEFERRHVKMIGLSANDLGSHDKWIDDINAISSTELRFPIIADADRRVAWLYDMISQQDVERLEREGGGGVAFTIRAVFVIDPAKRIRLTMLYPASTGRNTSEVLRVIDSLQMGDREGVTTPIDWQVGDDVIVPPSVTTEDARKKFGEVREVRPYLRYTKV
ncbi:Fungal specific transcription factor domain [Teratosphaeria destructans]|uniref:Fungal specific transcription factor domain n=1 Tax=Teratosphaeria destructans TaxID=418781 RepID=A0A9W7W146_9PEZI|nr:Fungal specific transcription factor domain [Teratosphaeria destructans]